MLESCSTFSIEEKAKRASFNWVSIELKNSLMMAKTNSTEHSIPRDHAIFHPRN